MSTPYRCAMSVVLARDAAVGLILRTGPRDWVQTVRWDTALDTFEPGQWFHGRIRPADVSLCPDGTLWMYVAEKPPYSSYSRPGPWWPVLGKVPWLTALVSRADVPTGRFVDDDSAAFGYGEPIPLPPRTTAYENVAAEPLPPDQWRLGGWDPAIRMTACGASLVFGPTADDLELPGVTWAGWDQRGRLAYTRGGLLLAATVDGDGQWRETLLADFDDSRQPDPRPSPEWAQQS